MNSPLLDSRAMRTALLALTVAALLIGCGDSAREEPAPPPWQRIDLFIERPQVEIAGPRRGRAFERRLEPLGPRDDGADVAEARRGRRAGSQVRTVAQQGGTRLAWSLRLPEDGYLSFVPLGSPDGACRCTYRTGVRDADGLLQELYQTEVGTDPAAAPATVELDLTPFGDTNVEIIFQVDPRPGTDLTSGPTPWALWGSPAIYGRREPEPATDEQPPSGGKTSEPAPARHRPDIVLLGFDTLRADALGPRGFRTTLSPALDHLAAKSDVWTRAFSAFNVTNPSFASILTGLWGKNHGVYDLVTPLPEEHTTLAEALSAAGYRTLAIIAARHLGPRPSGLGQGFDEVVVSDQTFAAELVVDMAIDYLDEHLPADRPVFVWLHLFDPHTPHTPPKPYALGLRPAEPFGLKPTGGWLPFRPLGARSFTERFLGGQRDLYDGEVAYLDRQVDRLVGFLEAGGHLPDTLLAAVADHGENLGDHGIDFRHAGLWDSTTHVPMMIRWPERQVPLDPAGRPHRGRHFDGLAQSIDLYPTLLAAAGLSADEIPPSDGRNLRDPHDEGRRAVFAEHAHGQGEMVRTADFKLILSRDNPMVPDPVMLYDLRQDPGETENLAGTGHPQEEPLRELLERWHGARRPAPKAAPAEMSEEDLERLRALGYL
ncbi:MAG: sulfatase [Acidobacteriota bacterium]